MTLWGIESFLAVAEEGAISAAARRLGVSPSAISQQLKAGQWSEVLDASAALPPAVQRDRAVLLMRLEAAENYSVTSRAAVLEDWLAAFPDEMDLPLKLADHYLTQERWDDAERVISRLLVTTGGDARLQSQLGNINWRRDRE